MISIAIHIVFMAMLGVTMQSKTVSEPSTQKPPLVEPETKPIPPVLIPAKQEVPAPIHPPGM